MLAGLSCLLSLSSLLLELSQADSEGENTVVKQLAANKYFTEIACEGQLLTLNCSDKNHVIKLLRANYGRFTLNICNDKGQDWANTQCYWPKTLRTLNDRCGGKRYCIVEASDQLFQDNCPETYKYLEAVYECIPDPNSTPSIPIVIADTTKGLATTPTTSTTTTTTASLLISTDKPTTTNNFQLASTTDKLIRYCPETNAYGVFWPATHAGFLCKTACPNNNASSFYAELFCGNDSRWDFSRLNLSNCVSQWILDLAKPTDLSKYREKGLTQSSLVEQAEQIRRQLGSQRLLGAEPQVITSAMVELISELSTQSESSRSTSSQMYRTRQWDKDDSELIGQNLIHASDSILSRENSEAWDYLKAEQNHLRTASNLLRVIDQSGFLADPARLRLESLKNMEVHVITVDRNNFDLLKQRGNLDSVMLSQKLLDSRMANNSAKLVFTKYHNMASLLSPKPVWRKSKRSHIEVNRTVVTKVLSASISGSKVENFDSAVSVVFAIDKRENLSNPHCVYWDLELMEWSQTGCYLVLANDTHGICTCNHLTNFAILMDIHGLQLDLINELALVTITYGGCIISIVCLFLTILAFQCFKGLHSERATIHKNLCFCLLVAESVFLGGINQTENRITCGIVAGVLHYFFLAAFTWMLLEGFQLYFLLIEVFEAEKSRRGYFYLFGYGMPLVIVSISVAIDHNSYGTEQSCWLNTENYFVLSFVGPAFVVILANMIFLTMAIVIMCRHTQPKSNVRAIKADSSHNYSAFVKGAVVLIVLLGLTWSFGLLYVNEGTIIFAYLFTVLNSLQGLFIFLFNIVGNDKVKKEYIKLLRRNDWLPDFMRGDITSTDNGNKSGNNQRLPESSSSEAPGLSPQNSTVTTLTSSSSIARLFRLRNGRKSSRNSTQSLLARNSSNMSKPGRLDLGMLSQSNGIPPAYVSYLGSNRQLIDPKTGVVYQLARVESDSDAELSPNQFSSDGGGVLPYMRFIPPPSFPPPPIPTYDHNSRMSKSADYSSPSEGYFSQWRNLTDNNNSASHLSFSSSFCEDHCRGDQFCSRNYHRSPRGEDSMPTIYEAPSIQSYCSAAVAPTTSFQQRHQQPNSTRLDNYNCYSYELDLSGDNLTGRQRNSRKFSSLRD